MAKKFGADIGYSTVRIVTPEMEGDYRSEPAVIAISVADGNVVACGEEALSLSARVPGSVHVVRPFSGEMTPDVRYITAYFAYVMKKLKLKSASLALSFSGAHDEETESVYVKGVQKAGVRDVSVVDPVYAAAQGCEVLNVGDSAVINIGASVTDMGCFSRGKQVAYASNSFAGNAFDRAISSDIMKTHRYRPDNAEAERIKRELATLSTVGDKTVEASVMRPTMGLPKKITVSESEVSGACESVFDNLADEISDMIRSVKPEPDKIILTGGSARLSGFSSALAPLLCLPIEVAREPEGAVIRGLAALLSQI